MRKRRILSQTCGEERKASSLSTIYDPRIKKKGKFYERFFHGKRRKPEGEIGSSSVKYQKRGLDRFFLAWRKGGEKGSQNEFRAVPKKKRKRREPRRRLAGLRGESGSPSRGGKGRDSSDVRGNVAANSFWKGSGGGPSIVKEYGVDA